MQREEGSFRETTLTQLHKRILGEPAVENTFLDFFHLYATENIYIHTLGEKCELQVFSQLGVSQSLTTL